MKNLATILISSCASVFAQQEGTFTDPRDGKVYKTVKIGEQTWFAENLNYEAEGSVCYENNPDNGAKYGRLYNWETAMKACPKGWHLPTNEEWDKLLRFVDSENNGNGKKDVCDTYDSKTAGKHLKAVSGWKPWVGIENLDTYGFSALPGGCVYDDGSFNNVGNWGYWWSASKYYDYGYGPYERSMINRYDNAFCGIDGTNSCLFSVRCLQD